MMTDSSTTFFGAAENMWREGGLRGASQFVSGLAISCLFSALCMT